MRGKDEQQLDVFSYISPEQRVPQDHPLRSLRAMTDEALRGLQPRFNKLYAKTAATGNGQKTFILLQGTCRSCGTLSPSASILYANPFTSPDLPAKLRTVTPWSTPT